MADVNKIDSNNTILDVGSTEKFNYNEQLHEQLTTLREKTNLVSADLCHHAGKTFISDVTSDDIKSATKVHKKQLGEHILLLISQCNIVCQNINVNHISNSDTDVYKLSESQFSEVSACVDRSLSSFFLKQNLKIQEIDEQVTILKDISNTLSSNMVSVSADKNQYDILYGKDVI